MTLPAIAPVWFAGVASDSEVPVVAVEVVGGADERVLDVVDMTVLGVKTEVESEEGGYVAAIGILGCGAEVVLVWTLLVGVSEDTLNG